MEELTLSFEEVVRNLHFIPYIEQEILRAFSRKEKWIQEIAETAYSGTDYDFPLLKRRPFFPGKERNSVHSVSNAC